MRQPQQRRQASCVVSAASLDTVENAADVRELLEPSKTCHISWLHYALPRSHGSWQRLRLQTFPLPWLCPSVPGFHPINPLWHLASSRCPLGTWLSLRWSGALGDFGTLIPAKTASSCLLHEVVGALALAIVCHEALFGTSTVSCESSVFRSHRSPDSPSAGWTLPVHAEHWAPSSRVRSGLWARGKACMVDS